VTVRVEVTTDQYPTEVSYTIHDQVLNLDVATVAFNELKTSYAVEVRSFELVPGRAYAFRILDASADGICCRYGSGGYTIVAEVITGEDVVLIEPRGDYYGSDEHSFFVPEVSAEIEQDAFLTIEIDLDSSPAERVGWSLHSTYDAVHGIDNRPIGYYAGQNGTTIETIPVPIDGGDLHLAIIMGAGGYYNVYRGKQDSMSPDTLLFHGGDGAPGSMVVHTISTSDVMKVYSTHTLDSEMSRTTGDLSSSTAMLGRSSAWALLISIVSLSASFRGIL
jgi:hypothetical protein